MGSYADRPWLHLYDPGLAADVELEHETGLAMFRATRERSPEATLLRYFDRTLSFAEVDELSDALACALAERGIEPGDRVVAYLQNVPQFVLTMLASWKAGAIMVSASPMLKAKELGGILRDSGARGLIALESLWTEVALDVVEGTEVVCPITTSELDFLDRTPPLLASSERRRADGVPDLLELIEAHRGERPAGPDPRPEDLALLTYTSGTTGPAKGAMNTHRGFVFNSNTYRDWIALDRTDVVLAMAPLFHVTGLVGNIGACFLSAAPLVLAFRYDAATQVELIDRCGVTFAISATTAFIALMNEPTASRERLSTLTKIYSGGSPTPAAVAEAWEERFGSSIRSAYGMTEITGPCHLAPLGRPNAVDPGTGALSVGVPVFDTVAAVLDDAGEEVPAGEVGEIVIRSPGVVPGYWRNQAETDAAIGPQGLRTGDVGYMDAAGWFYVVDRLKDLINVSGYKVWPREVEDAVYAHPAVRETAVVGVADDYRGETVKAFVVARAGQQLDPEELIAFCRERLAAYKYPRQVEVVPELPKTASGKIMRRQLRDRGAASPAANG